MTQLDRVIIIASGVMATVIGARTLSPRTVQPEQNTPFLLATAMMEDVNGEDARRDCKLGYRVELISQGKDGLSIQSERVALSGCAGVQFDNEPRKFVVMHVQTVGGTDKLYVANDSQRHATARLVDHRNRPYIDDQQADWSFSIEESPATGVTAQTTVQVQSVGTVDHRNDATSGERVVFVDLWFVNGVSRDHIPTALFPLHVIVEKTLPLPDRPHGYRVAVASELPIIHVLSQIRPVEEVDLVGEASEARYEN